MKYSESTLANFVEKATATVKSYLGHGKEYKVHISVGNNKIGYTHNFSTLPILTCGNCKECKHSCYDIKACLQYKNVMQARAENTAFMREDMHGCFKAIDKYISGRRTHKFFRWHVAGEIMSLKYFKHMIKIARKHPDWTFWTYTKRYDIVNEYCRKWFRRSIPKNFTVMFSVWQGMPLVNPYDFPTFECIPDHEELPADVWLCPGNCEVCKAAHRGCVYGESSCVREH